MFPDITDSVCAGKWLDGFLNLQLKKLNIYNRQNVTYIYQEYGWQFLYTDIYGKKRNSDTTISQKKSDERHTNSHEHGYCK